MTGGQVGALITGAVLVFWMVGAYNRLVALRNAIGGAWAQVEEQLQRRRQALEAMVGALRPVLQEEPTALDALVGALLQVQAAADAVRARPVSASLVTVLVTAEQVLGNALARLLALLEHHPQLRDEMPEVAQGLQALQDAEPRLAFARQLFNDAAQAYNDAARQFPTRLLTQLYGFGTAGRL
ncbi:LemA family protein [Ideonella sp. BN130291]|uniref:LemA family protein n=1 Tax=Ideonella sp. BN130291 TaxID=3112940 RepID=UPI002E25DF38|nr:LemA family protein [Ideonella sp. BN130291]